MHKGYNAIAANIPAIVRHRFHLNVILSFFYKNYLFWLLIGAGVQNFIMFLIITNSLALGIQAGILNKNHAFQLT